MTLQEIRHKNLFKEFKPINTIIHGDAWVVSKSLPSDYVQSIVTSPPYFGHREYSDDQKLALREFGREDHHNDYVQKLVRLDPKPAKTRRDTGPASVAESRGAGMRYLWLHSNLDRK